MKRFTYFNTHPAPHPKAPICRLCGERINHNDIIKLCQDCKDDIIYEKEQNEFWEKYHESDRRA